jgi:hypothetical protein
MGNWYTNIALKGVEPNEVLRSLGQLGRRAIVNPAQEGWVTVFDEECEKFDLDAIESLALTLSTELHCTALPCLNADDDELWFAIYENGQRTSRYASALEQFEDAAEFPSTSDFALALCRVCEKPDQLAQARAVLERSRGALGLLRMVGLTAGYVFEIQRHTDLATLLGLPSASVGLGFRYVNRGELAEGMQAENLLKTFGRTN